MTSSDAHPGGCHCRACLIERLQVQSPHLAERIAARQEADRRGEKPLTEYRRGKPVVSKGCKGCHGGRK